MEKKYKKDLLKKLKDKINGKQTAIEKYLRNIDAGIGAMINLQILFMNMSHPRSLVTTSEYQNEILQIQTEYLKAIGQDIKEKKIWIKFGDNLVH